MRLHGEDRGASDIADLLDLDRPLGETLKQIAKRRGSDVSDLMVIMLDRERHADAVEQVRECSADPLHHRRGRVRGDARGDGGTGIDLLWGSAAPRRASSRPAAIKSMGGHLIGRLWPRDEDERSRARDAGYDLDEVLDVNRLVSGEDVFFAATGVTDGDLLQGVRYRDGAAATTESLVMRSRSGTVRKVQATHNFARSCGC